jgi:hypothetical protein
LLEVEIEEKNDAYMTFRLPSELKLQLPGAYEEKLDDGTPKIDKYGNAIVKFKNGRAIGKLFRDLATMYVLGEIEQKNTMIRSLKDELVAQSRKEATLTLKIRENKKEIEELAVDRETLRLGVLELLKLMKTVRPTAKQMERVDVSKINALKGVTTIR